MWTGGNDLDVGAIQQLARRFRTCEDLWGNIFNVSVFIVWLRPSVSIKLRACSVHALPRGASAKNVICLDCAPGGKLAVRCTFRRKEEEEKFTEQRKHLFLLFAELTGTGGAATETC